MNRGILSMWVGLAGAAALMLAVGHFARASGPPDVPLAATQPEAQSEDGPFAGAPVLESPKEASDRDGDEPGALPENGDEPSPSQSADIVTAPATPISNIKTLPPNIPSTGPVAEVVKLENAGMGEAVVLAYVTNSTARFNLGADEIIYLNDIGVSSQVVQAMLQRDQRLAQEAGAPSAPQPMAPESAEQAPPPGAEIAGQDVAPQFGEQPPADTNQVVPPEDATLADSDFYGALAPYGSWLDVQGYGPCWRPSVVISNPGWQPYFDCGHWVYSDCGWYWLSDYTWGWAPFHYGRWFRHERFGWCWLPDRVWGPSWVCWRYSHDYCGWAPLPPGASFRAGLGLAYHGRHLDPSFHFGLGASSFRFVHWRSFSDRHLRGDAISPHLAARIYARSSFVNGISAQGRTAVNRGLAPERVASATHTRVRTLALRDGGPGRGAPGRAERFDRNAGTLSVYRPTFSESHRPNTPAGRPVAGRPPALSSAARPEAAAALPRASETPQRVWPAQSGFARNRFSSGPAAAAPAHTAQQLSPLILRGHEQISVPSPHWNDPPPANSLVIIGRKDHPRAQSSSAALPFQQSRIAGVPRDNVQPARTANPPARMANPGQNRTPWLAAETPARPAFGSENARPHWPQTAPTPAPAPGGTRGFDAARPNHESPARNNWNEAPRRNFWSGNSAPQREFSAPRQAAPSRSPAMETPHYAPAPSAPRSSAPAPAPSRSSGFSGRSSR